jgi:hypothetical protein
MENRKTCAHLEKIKKSFRRSIVLHLQVEWGDFGMLKNSINVNKDEDTSAGVVTLHSVSDQQIFDREVYRCQ